MKDIEIICINDGSTDSSLEILKEYAKNDTRIKIINKQNTGYGHSMNVGLDNAQGEYVGIVEPDDYVELNMYEDLYSKAKETNVDFIKADHWHFSEDMIQHYKEYCASEYYNRIINPKTDKKILNCDTCIWSGIYKSDFLKSKNVKFNETPGARYQDQGFYWQTTILADSFYILNRAFYHYRFLNTNSTSNPNGFNWLKPEYDYILGIINKCPELKAEFIYLYRHYEFCTYLCRYKRLGKKQKKKKLQILRNEYITALKNNEIDKSLFTSYEASLFDALVKNPKKFYRKSLNRLSLFQKIFSIKNTQTYGKVHKIVRICGLKFKFRNKSKEAEIKLEEQRRAILHIKAQNEKILKYLKNNASKTVY